MSVLPSEACPRFEQCKANICPLDPAWRDRPHLRGEAVCFYLREFVNHGGAERVRAAEAHIADAIEAVPEITSRTSPFWSALQRAATQSSKLVAGKQLNCAARSIETAR